MDNTFTEFTTLSQTGKENAVRVHNEQFGTNWTVEEAMMSMVFCGYYFYENGKKKHIATMGWTV